MYFKAIIDSSSIQRQLCFKPILQINYHKYIYLFGHYYKYFKKTTKFKYKNTTTGEQKGEVIVYSLTTA